MTVALMDRVAQAAQVATVDERLALIDAMQGVRTFGELPKAAQRLVVELEKRPDLGGLDA